MSDTEKEVNLEKEEKKPKFSYSRLDKYKNCPFAYWLTYVEHHYSKGAGLAALFGTLVHMVLENIGNNIRLGEPIDYDALKETFRTINVAKKDPMDREGDIYGSEVLSKLYPEEWYDCNTKSGKNYDMKADDFIYSGIYRLMFYMEEHPTYKIVGCEVPFDFEWEGHLFCGFIDRLLYDTATDTYIIQDIKTRDTPFSQSELTTPLQFVVYTMALQKMYGEDVKVLCEYDLPIADVYQSAGSKGFVDRGQKKLRSLFEGIEDEFYDPHPSPLCYWCNFRTGGKTPKELCEPLCPYYALWTPNYKNFKDTFIEFKSIKNYAKDLDKMLKIHETRNSSDDDEIEI